MNNSILRLLSAALTNFSCAAALAGSLLFLAVAGPRPASAQEAWEYAPYKVCIWYTLDPTLDTSPAACNELTQRVTARLESTFRSAWTITETAAPANFQSLIERGPQHLAVEHLTNTDLVLVLAKDDPSTKTLRVWETAVEQLNKFAITKADRVQIDIDSQSYNAAHKAVPLLLEKASQLFDTYDELAAAIKAKQVSAALIPRGQLAAFAESTRSVATALPWHTEKTLHDFDKLFIVHLARSGEEYRVAVRELDCPMRLFGPTIEASTVSWKSLPADITDSMVRAFAPVARIEETAGKIVRLRTRAGGLMIDANPAQIQPGDVLQPVIRRDDRRGVATLLEPIPWTYIGITSGNSITIEGTAYSALGNVLQGKQTRRAQRVALRVRPIGDYSDLKIVVRTDLSEAQPGCQIYERDLMTEELRFVGTTDWRGILRIERPDPPGAILPESERLRRAEARRQAAATATLTATSDKASQADERGAAPSNANTANVNEPEASQPHVNETDGGQPNAANAIETGQAEGVDAAEDRRGPTADERSPKSDAPQAIPSALSEATAAGVGASGAGDQPQVVVDDAAALSAGIPLRQPLVLLYVKSGDMVLARLPLVPGLNEVDVADLPSDARRLEAEAILRGFQGDIIDLIGRRALAAARVAQFLSEKKFTEAEEVIGEVRRLRDYKSMADTLDSIQRRLLDESKEAVPMAAKTRIDRMTQNTRDMLQKYVEADLAQRLDRDLREARARAAEEDKITAEAAKAADAAKAEKAAPGKATGAGTSKAGASNQTGSSNGQSTQSGASSSEPPASSALPQP